MVFRREIHIENNTKKNDYINTAINLLFCKYILSINLEDIWT
jgi:hypothetical protein